MDPVQRTNHDKLALRVELQAARLKPAAIMAAADTGQNLLLQQAFQKDTNQDLPALLLINQALAAIARDHLAELEDTDPTQQGDLLEGLQVQAERVDLDDNHYLQWILVLVQNHLPVNMLLQNLAKKKQQENSKTSKILKPTKNQ